ncbi:hypothetical protein NOV72_05218 [Caballeronia novacaledonica]|uniref:Gluconolactonase n=1 Tax=Caballeronia novacaledonica TaxID=1544861 RepID=A0A2U3ID05_9BURK|nr:hypothetical protein [Caballeronia novacaledonica]SPB18019.1 hypothetical protein NOV72_05218 [Caballeronia novacaledonica]
MKKNPHRIRLLMNVALCFAALVSATNARSDDRNARNDFGAVDDVLAVGVFGPGDPATPPEHSTVKFFDARSGRLLYQLPDASGGLAGPTGILFDDGRMIVANQNTNRPFKGEVLQYGPGIKPGTPLVSRGDANAPLAPRGILLVQQRGNGKRLFIADLGDPASDVNGKLLVFDIKYGKAMFRHDMNPGADVIGAEFRPRGLVLGPDGYLWVTLAYLTTQCGGKVARFDPVTLKYKDTVLSNSSDCSKDANHLNRPEGLAFAPNGDLFITSFKNVNVDADIDRILILRADDRIYRRPQPQLDFIPLDVSGDERTSTQALVFGPGGYLYVACLQNGEVRKYDVVTKGYWTIVPPGTQLTMPFYLSFFKTNPATLDYEGRDGHRKDYRTPN